MKHRVIESTDGRYYPQVKTGLFRKWIFLSKYADDKMFLPLERLMTERDPAQSACFETASEAEAFIAQVFRAIEKYWAEEEASREREAQGVSVRRVVKD